MEYFEESGKLFQTLLYFMKEAKAINPQVLRLSREDSITFKQHILPGLIKIIGKAAEYTAFNSLEDTIQFLLIYEEMMNGAVTSSKKQRSSGSTASATPNQFDILSVIVEIADGLLENKKGAE